MLSFDQCAERVSAEINTIAQIATNPKELYEPVNYILQLGGKRIRPVMVLMGCNAFTDKIDEAIPAALAIEVFHNFTLVHDDIMDNAPIRRNKPTIHEKWDANTAILSGDAMQIIAYKLLCKSNPKYVTALLDIFNKTALEVCEGQQYDMNFANQKNVSLQEYLRMIELKTSVLIGASLQLGAICGGATSDDAQKLYEFGRNLGLAFQIKDDFLDIYANPEVFGKAIGGDIAENKKTYLLIKALELAKDEDAEILHKAVTRQIADIDIRIEMVKMVYDNLHIDEITEEAIGHYSTIAFENLDGVNIPQDRKKELKTLALSLMNREK